MKKLAIFDIDETVFHTYAKINVIKNNKIIKRLSNQEFNNYRLKKGESFDFKEFRDSEVFYNTSKPIFNIIKLVKKYIEKNDKVIFLTAREDFKDKEKFLETFRKYGIDIDNPNVYIERSGNLKHLSSVDERKKEIMKKYIKDNLYNHIKIYDDNRQNLETLKNFIQIYGLKVNTIQVSGNGKMKKI